MSDQSFQTFNARVDTLVKLGKPHIAFGLLEPHQETLASLKRGQEYADITLVGPSAIKDVEGFDLVIEEEPEVKLATMLVQDTVDGIIRGTIDDFKTYETYKKLTGEECTAACGLLETPPGHQFFLALASNPEGWDREDRYQRTLATARFVQEWGVTPRVAVFSGTRHDTYARKKDITEGVTGILNKTYEEAEWMVREFEKEGFEVKNWSIDSDKAIAAGYNVISPVNGMVGNQMFRIVLASGGKFLTATRIGLSRVYEDNSRNEVDYEFHVKWAVAMINRKNILHE